MTNTISDTLRVAGAAVALVLCAAIAPLSPAQSPATTKPQTAGPATKPQPAAKRESIQIMVVKVKPEMLDQWLEFQRSETIPMLKKSGLPMRDAWTTATFGEGFTYAFVTPIESFAQYDGDARPVRALGADAARAYGEKNRRFVESTHTYFAQTRPDLSHDIKMTAPPKLALLSTVQLAPGKSAEFEAFVKSDVLPVMRKARVGYAVSETVLGGTVGEMTTLIFYDSFAEIGKGHPFQRILGVEGERQLTARAAAFVARVERNVIRYVPELSFAARPTS